MNHTKLYTGRDNKTKTIMILSDLLPFIKKNENNQINASICVNESKWSKLENK